MPGLLVWPDQVKVPRAVETPFCTTDYLPTIAAALGWEDLLPPRPMDGVHFMSLAQGETSRGAPIHFR